jgi:hypothetical protein
MIRVSKAVKILLVIAGLLLGLVAGQAAGILAVASGASLAAAFLAGGAAFASAVTLVLLVQNSILT